MSAGPALSVLGNALINPSNAGPGPVTVDDLVPILEDIAYRFSIVADIMQDADDKATDMVNAATDTATQAEKIGQNVKDIVNHTYTVVIPHSLSWLSGYLVSHFIAPLQTRMTTAEKKVSALQEWEGAIKTWRAQFVDPDITLLIGFRDWFIGWPESVVFTVHDWLDNPGHFADWAAAPLIGPLVAYLAAPEHKQTRDNLTNIIADAWADSSNDVFGDVLAFLLANT